MAPRPASAVTRGPRGPIYPRQWARAGPSSRSPRGPRRWRATNLRKIGECPATRSFDRVDVKCELAMGSTLRRGRRGPSRGVLRACRLSGRGLREPNGGHGTARGHAVGAAGRDHPRAVRGGRRAGGHRAWRAHRGVRAHAVHRRPRRGRVRHRRPGAPGGGAGRPRRARAAAARLAGHRPGRDPAGRLRPGAAPRRRPGRGPARGRARAAGEAAARGQGSRPGRGTARDRDPGAAEPRGGPGPGAPGQANARRSRRSPRRRRRRARPWST